MARFKRQSNKYGATKQTYNGYSYDSKKEAAYAKELDWRKKAGEITEVERQVKISCDVNGKHVCNYFMDFRITLPDGRKEFHEVKGFETAVWRLKWKLSQARYPDCTFVLVK